MLNRTTVGGWYSGAVVRTDMAVVVIMVTSIDSATKVYDS